MATLNQSILLVPALQLPFLSYFSTLCFAVTHSAHSAHPLGISHSKITINKNAAKLTYCQEVQASLKNFEKLISLPAVIRAVL